MEAIIIDAGIKFLLAFLVIVLFAFFKVKDEIGNQFDLKIFIDDNKQYWAWTLSVVFVILLIVTIEPDGGTAIKSITGLDINETRASFLTLGWGLSLLVNKTIKNPIGNKTVKTPQINTDDGR